MRQVPYSHSALLLGSGRMASHLAHYFSLLGLPHASWKTPRLLTEDFFAKSAKYDQIWILVSDGAIHSVAEKIRKGFAEHLGSDHKLPTLLHTSGATVVQGVLAVHPLMTFGPELYSLQTYKDVPLIVDEGAACSIETLPNQKYRLDPTKRALYHALVTLSGNFPAMLWSETFDRFESDLGLPAQVLAPFVMQSFFNVMRPRQDRSGVLTGAIVRGDQATITSHRTELARLNQAYADLYRAFELFYQNIKTSGGSHVVSPESRA